MTIKVMTIHSSITKQVGFSLVELLITLVISATVTSGLFTLYLNTRLSQEFSQASAQVQESGRFALEYLTRDIRMIGYQGCSNNKPPTINIKANNIPQGYDPFEQELIGYDIEMNWHLGTQFENVSAIRDRIKLGTSALLISRIASLGTFLMQSQITKTDSLFIDTPSASLLNLKQDDILYISDCVNADIFSVSLPPVINGDTTVLSHSTNTNIVSELSTLYQKNAHIAKYQSYLYFIGDTQRINKTGDKVYALYQADIDYADFPTRYVVNELIAGVENLQIRYGEILPSSHIRYTQSHYVSDMKNVTSIKLGLLINSLSHVKKHKDTTTYYVAQKPISASDEASYNSNGENHYVSDKRLRHAFNTTINIRNRNHNYK